ncbi:MAG TPA: chromosome partitioning protein [Spirochaetia bacterium]|mgnify:FL=1|nr:chromosome partitioning protein [Spirochaetales bacterium]HRS64366.1 chromosome partitioning protein [Spirochaetia bacterium]HOT59393.1 chromosome partitioning protein [Spirochaetales bacterium]HPD80727.1 chromosome partitioning protein [Spirochaetales bacterium]HQG40473.1 chromosome partitioning protein [Spirochaetales bacterium]
MEETNLEGLTPEDAHAYILEYATSKKLTEKEREAVLSEIAAWSQKQQLAQTQGRADLVEAAQKKLQELTAKQAQLEQEIADLTHKIDIMKQQLPLLKARERSVDPDLLLAEMEMTLGKSADDLLKEKELNSSINTMNADEELKKLKEKLANQDKSE